MTDYFQLSQAILYFWKLLLWLVLVVASVLGVTAIIAVPICLYEWGCNVPTIASLSLIGWTLILSVWATLYEMHR